MEKKMVQEITRAKEALKQKKGASICWKAVI
jgi:hypothetical protein